MKVEDIKNPSFLKDLDDEQLNSLALDIRKFLISNISKTGGHLSSNLGIVELTIALHYVFSSPKDKIFFDVGHQSYIHKILTGRAKDFETLRKFNGLSGFQKRCESEHDVWEAGHSSTSLSAAIAMAVARDLNKEDYSVVPVIGDASMVSGESLEALNHLGSLNQKVIIILNDNQMAISKPVGGVGQFLGNVRLSDAYNNMKKDYKSALAKGKIGNGVYRVTKRIKDFFKHGLINDTIFEDFGIDYLGPVNGHNIHELIRVLNLAKKNDKSVVVHVITEKGKGYKYAENDTTGIWHGVGPFDIKSGEIRKSEDETLPWSSIVAKHVEKHMQEDKDIVAITPAMINGSSLDKIFNKYPNRSFDVGIAEEHAMSFAAGLSISKKKPFLSIYSSFMQRAYDQLNQDISRMDLPCLISIDRSGIVGCDGPTHNGVFDIGLCLSLPNVILFAPKDALETKKFINTAFVNNDHPYLMRIPKASICDQKVNTTDVLKIGSWQVEQDDKEKEVIIISYGNNINRIESSLKDSDIKYQLINARFIKPMDTLMLDEIVKENLPIVVYETDLKINSLYSMIVEYYTSSKDEVDIYGYGIGDHFSKQGSIEEVLKDEKLDMNQLISNIKGILNEERKN